jgi:hypothetical protein
MLMRFRKPKAICFISYVEYRPNTNTSNIIYTYKYIQNMNQKVGLIEETKGGGKTGRKVAKNYEVHHICVGTTHKETH